MDVFVFSKNRCLLFLFVSFFSLTAIAQDATVQFQIFEEATGQLMPARLTVLEGGKPFPMEVPSIGEIATRENIIYTATGNGTFTIAPGDYEFWFGKGMEYSVDIQKLSFKSGEKYAIKAHLKKELNTDGFIGGDMHLHTFTNSGHGDANLLERVISCTAEGLDWAVATDHNFITDYQPYMKQAGLSGLMKTSVGNEVSTSVGHYNTYPISAKGQPINSKPTDLNLLFDSIRLDAGKEVVIQVNHPRWIASDFFNTKGLDIYFGTINHPEWSWDFDAIEVLNENYQLGWKTAPDNLQSVKRDWFNLLNHNRRITGLGNSDSHDVVKAIAGVPRNYILSSTDIPAKIDEKELSTNIKAQRVSVACGIFTKITVNGKNAMGETFKSDKERLELQLEVQAPSWVDCTKAQLIRNGVVVKTYELKASETVERLNIAITVKPDRDSWYALIASGEKSMFPMVGKLERPVYPLGFTNPVWVDADGDGTIQSVFDASKSVVEEFGNETAEFLTKLLKEPEMIPYVFYHLFETKHENAIKISEAFFNRANTEQRRILFRELAKTELEGAQSLLLAFQKLQLTPLEEIVLASYVNFPIQKSRLENFKSKKNGQPNDLLEQQLNYLETKLTYIYSGAIEQNMELGYNRKDELNSLWEARTADKNGFFHFKPRRAGQYLMKSNWKMRKDTSLYFYLQSNQKCNLFVNGKKTKVLPPRYKMDIFAKLIEVSLKKGDNEVILLIPAQTQSSFCFYQAGENMLLDPSKKIETVEHLALDKNVNYLTEYHFKYHGYGNALTDGFRGEESFGDQLWQGWEGKNAEFIVDLGTVQSIEKILLGTLANQGSWIFFPKKVSFLISENGEDYSIVFEEELNATEQLSASMIRDIGGNITPAKARYIKVVAENIEVLPDWHNNKGEPAWIFLDELIVQ